MIVRCRRRHLEHVCKKRGYALADVMPCVVSQDGDVWSVDTDHPAYPHREPTWRPFLLGDFVERRLTALGITKARVERWTRTEGKPGGCGCAGRKRWLNEWGVRVQTRARSFARWYAKAVFG